MKPHARVSTRLDTNISTNSACNVRKIHVEYVHQLNTGGNMKHLALILFTMFVISSAHSEDLFGPDKQGHFLISTGIATGSTLILNNPRDKLTPFAITMAVGLAKEVCDQYCGGGSGFSRNDLLADAAGAYLGTIVGTQGLLFLSHKNKTVTLNFFALF